MSKASYSFTWNQSRIGQLQKNVMVKMAKLGEDIGNQAKRNAPYLSGVLVNSIRVITDKNDEVVILAGGKAGGFEIPYAKRREYENHKNPGTRYYMKRAFESETKDLQSKFRGVTQ